MTLVRYPQLQVRIVSADEEGRENRAPLKEEAVVETAEDNQMELSMNSIVGINPT